MKREDFTEDLGGGVGLGMVLIPEGRFLMGSPADEEGRFEDEGPQHEVRVGAFYLGRYAVTQAQWKAVSRLPKVQMALEPSPSRFKGPDRPVEQVSWHEAAEFCRRLSRWTGSDYRLPSEAEWEYACRAGTKTPFHFGPTITPELVNYNGNYPYGGAPRGKYRGKTTRVGELGVANGYGLFDMHGNVCEWCQDAWHDSYEGAPDDGSAWGVGGEASGSVVRGGSWFELATGCRSAQRGRSAPADRHHDLGFRVASPEVWPLMRKG